MNSPFSSATKFFNPFKKRDRLTSDTDGGLSKAGFFNSGESVADASITPYDTEFKRMSRSKSFEFKPLPTNIYNNFDLTDSNPNFSKTTAKHSSCECAGKVLALLNQILTYCGTLQIERDRALESLRVEKECKERSVSLLNESLAREKLLIKEIDDLRDQFNNLKHVAQN